MKRMPAAILFASLSAILIASMIAGLCWGVTDAVTPTDALSFLMSKIGLHSGSHGDDALTAQIVWNARLPRVLVAALVGAGLAVSGAALQALFANDLASPDIIGVSSGGALGAVLAIHLGIDAAFIMALPLAAFCGALAAALIVFAVAARRARTPVATIILAGVAINAMLGGAVSFILIMDMGDIEASRRIIQWLIGGLDARLMDHVIMAAPLVLAGCAWAMALAGDLDCLATGHDWARSAGVSIQSLKAQTLVLASIATGAGVAVCGVLAFVGLVVPHIMRILVGPGHRRLIPACFLGGAAFLVLMDLASRVIVPNQEIRVGIITSFLGGPFFLYLIVRYRRKAGAP